MRDPHPIEVLIAKAHGRPVKSLARWGTRWYPGRDDRSQVLMGRWMVPDPEDRVAQIDAAPGTRGGEWVPTDIPPYWTEMAEAWPLWSEVATLAGTFSGADGYAIIEFAEAGEHESEICNLETTYDAEDQDLTSWSAHLHLGLLGANTTYPPGWSHGATFCARGTTAMQAICLTYLLAQRIAIPRTLLLSATQIRARRRARASSHRNRMPVCPLESRPTSRSPRHEEPVDGNTPDRTRTDPAP